MRLTPNFDSSEFVVSKAQPELAKQIEVTEADLVKMFQLCINYLQPIRDKFGPVNILSGKRSVELNEAIGGSLGSQHMYENFDAAVDFAVPGKSMETVYNFIKNELNKNYGELIFYPDQNFIHVSLPTQTKLNKTWIKT